MFMVASADDNLHLEFVDEALRLVQDAEARGIQLRILGSIAYRIQCPGNLHLFDDMARVLTDVDFGALKSQNQDIREFFLSEGYQPDEGVYVASEGARHIYLHPETKLNVDVFADEPGSGTADFDSDLAKHPSVVATHHVGASTAQAQDAVTAGTLETINAYRTGSPINCVNLDPVPTRAATLTVRHHDRVGVLANVLQALRNEQLNVSNMQNRVFAGSKAAVASIDVGHLPSQALIDEVMSLDDVIYVSVTPA